MMGRQSPQTSLFEVSALVEPKIGRGSIYYLLHHLGDEYLSDEDFASMYSRGEGRYSLPPSLLARVTLLQRHDNVSDREAAARVRFDLRWLYALRLPIGYEGFAHSNLSHFRARLIVHGLKRLPFDRFNQLAIEVGVLDPEGAQAIDSSHIFGAGAVQDTYRLLRSALRKLLAVLVQQEPDRARQLIIDLDLAEYQSSAKPDIDWADPEARAAWLKQVVEDSEALLTALHGTSAATPEVREAAALLSQILNQDIEYAEDGPQLRQGVAPDRVVSTTDPEMRHGRKSSSQRFDGWKVHITEDVKSELITEVTTTPGNTPDGDPVVPMMEQQQERLGGTPRELLSDSQQGTLDNRVALQDPERNLNVELVAKLPPNTNQGLFTKEEFTIDLVAGAVTCPAGHTVTRASTTRDSHGRRVPRFHFPAALCQACPLKDRCTRSKKGGRSVTLHYHEELLHEVRAYNATEEFRERYRRRAIVERKLGELLWHHGLRFGRYIGEEKIEFQALWTAAVVNLKRLGKLAAHLFGPAPSVELLAA